MEKYIGDKKIMTVSISSYQTPIGSEMVHVLFEDGTSKIMPKALVERLQTDTPVDATAMRKAWIDPIINQTIVLLQESDVKMEDLDYFVSMLLTSIDDKCNRANAALYGVEYYPQRTILSVEKVLHPLVAESTTNNESTTEETDTDSEQG